MKAAAPITARHTFGWEQEKRLLSFFSEHLGEEIQQTTDRFAHQDGLGQKYLVELKSREAQRYDRYNKKYVPINSKSYPDGWLMPYCKIQNLPHDKQLYFFYYYAGDDTLWVCPYEKDKFADLKPFYPPFNPHQLHILIPVALWSQVECYTGL